MLEGVKRKVGKTVFMHLSRTAAFLEENKEPEFTPVMRMLYEKFTGSAPERITRENFERLLKAIESSDMSADFVDGVKKKFGLSFEQAALLSVLNSNDGFLPMETLRARYNELFGASNPLTEDAFEENLNALEVLGHLKRVLNGVAITPDTKKEIADFFQAKKKSLDLRAELSDYDDPSNTEKIMNALEVFFSEYPSDSGERKYFTLISSMVSGGEQYTLPVDYMDVESVLPHFALELVSNPEDMLRVMNDALSIFIARNFNTDNAHKFSVGIRNLPRSIMPRDAQRGEYISKLIQVEGIVTRVSEVKPFLEKAVFVCKDCGNEMVRVQYPYLPLSKPTRCDACGSRNIFIDHRASKYDNVQYIRIQDFPDRLRGGEMPRHIEVVLKSSDLIDRVKAGDKVRITGILHVDETRNMTRATAKVLLVATWVENENKDYYDIEITAEDERKIIEFSKREDALNVLRDSIAPKIKGYKMEKLGILLLLFGGVPKTYRGTRKRGDIHILLFGDYATAKSQLMKSAIELAPRGLLVTSSHVSKAGLGAAAIRDEHTGEYVLEAGAFVIADNGTVGIDELDKMPKDIRDALHEILENQQISVNKAGINAVLNTRASCIATANPKAGKYNPHKQFVEQTNIPPTLLSRFDLIFIFMDEPEEKKDREIAEIILDDSKYDVETELLDMDFMRKYIAYARQNINPRMSREAINAIADYYVKIRKKAKESADPTDGYVKVPITARQLEAIKRLAEAAARARLKNVVGMEEVKIAIDLVEYTLKKLIIDEEGEFDIAIIESGKSVSTMKKVDVLLHVIKTVEKEHEDEPGAPFSDVVELAKQYGLTQKEVEELIEKAKNTSDIYEPRRGYYKVLTSF